MTRDQFQSMLKAEFEEILKLNSTKGHDYAGDEDALRNFKEVGKRSGQTPINVWSVYYMKHEMSIETYVREGGLMSEPIEGRIRDAILYLFLLLGLIQEQTDPFVGEHPTVELDPPTAEMR